MQWGWLSVGGARWLLGGAIVATALVVAIYLFPTPHADVRRAAGDPGPGPGRTEGGIQVWQDLRYADTDATRLDVYRPAGAAEGLPGVLVVHGGAWRDGDKARMSGVSRRIARAGLIAYSVNYSLARRSRPGFPTQQRQLRQAVRWARRTAPRFGLAPRRIGALGTSAGGHLVGLLATRESGPLSAGPRVRAVATWSAPFDLVPLAETMMANSIDNFLGCLDSPCPDRQAAASPITHVSEDDPAMLLVNSRAELVPVSQAREMAGRLSAAGVPHSLRVLGGSAHAMDYAARAIKPTAAFLRRSLRGHSPTQP